MCVVYKGRGAAAIRAEQPGLTANYGPLPGRTMPPCRDTPRPQGHTATDRQADKLYRRPPPHPRHDLRLHVSLNI